MSNRLYSPTRRATCAAGRCLPGRCVCPCPQACELPAAAIRTTQPTTPMRAVALRAAAGAAFVLAVLLLVFLASGS